MDFKSLLTLLKNFDFKYIISELKKLRKGAVMIVLVISFCCAILDFCLKKSGIVYGWLMPLYLSVTLFSAVVLLIKIYNDFCDRIDKQKAAKQAQNEYMNFIAQKAHLLKPVLDMMNAKEKEYLKKFVDENTQEIFIKRDYGLNDPVLIANYITGKIYSTGYYLLIGCNMTHVSLKIDREFLDVLKIYFG